MLFAALAERASTFTDAGAQLRAGVFEDRDGTEKQTCEDGDRRGEEQDRSIDADIMNAREPIAGDIGVELLEGGTGPEPAEGFEAEVAEEDFVAVKLKRG